MIAVIGGGIIGACTAFELQQRGHAVQVFDAGYAGQASWASAGMLAPNAETLPEAVQLWAQHSMQLWPSLAQRLQDKSGLDVQLRFGLLQAATTSSEAEQLKQRHPDSQQPSPAVLAHHIQGYGSHFYPDDGWVNPRLVCQAALSQVPLEHAEVLSLGYQHPHWQLHFSDGRQRNFRQVVIAAGAWSGQFGAAVSPVQGQIALYPYPSAQLTDSAKNTMYPYPTYAGHSYVVPRQEGLYLGATHAQTWDTHSSPSGQAELADYAQQYHSSLAHSSPREYWVGLRPFSHSGSPIIGPDAQQTGLWWATGHYRNGVLLAAYTAHTLAEQLSRTLQAEVSC